MIEIRDNPIDQNRDFNFALTYKEDIKNVIESSRNNAHIVVIGAGPVGLLTAILLKIQHVTLNIFLIEKRKKYERIQYLTLHPKEILSIVKNADLPSHTTETTEFNKMIKELISESPLSILKVEKRFRGFAENLGIDIQNEVDEITNRKPEENIRKWQEKNVKRLEQLFPNAELFIGADGAKSKVRELICPQSQFKTIEQNLFEKNVSHRKILQLQYKIHLQSQATRVFEIFNYVSEIGYLTERISRDNTTKTVEFEIYDSNVYENIRDTIHQARLNQEEKILENIPDESVGDNIRIWFGEQSEKVELQNEQRINITAFELVSYISNNHFCKPGYYDLRNNYSINSFGNKYFCLVGDASVGLSYFRGIHFGFNCSSQLAKLTKIFLKNVEDLKTESILNTIGNKYEEHVRNQFFGKWKINPYEFLGELRLAMLKTLQNDVLIKSINFFRRIIPCHVVKCLNNTEKKRKIEIGRLMIQKTLSNKKSKIDK